MRAFLTGATGFVGQSLSQELTRQGIDVVGYRRSRARPNSGGEPAIRWIEGSLTDAAALTAAMEGCDVVFHVAAKIGYDPRDDAELRETNVMGTRAVVAACLVARIPRLVHTSSIAACAHSLDGSLLDERRAWNSGALRIDYFTTKHLAETEVLRGVERGLDAVIVNPGSIFGAGSSGNTAKTLRDLARRRIPFAPPGGSACIGVDDVVAGHLAAWRKGRRGERYVLNSENLTWKELLGLASSVLGVDGPRWVAPASVLRAGARVLDLASHLGVRQPNVSGLAVRALTVFLFFSGEKARQELDFHPAPMRQVLDATVSALRARGQLA